MIDYGHFGECFSMFEYQCQVCVPRSLGKR